MKTVIDLTSLADNFSGFERFALNIALELLRQNPNQTFVLVLKAKYILRLKCTGGNRKSRW